MRPQLTRAVIAATPEPALRAAQRVRNGQRPWGPMRPAVRPSAGDRVVTRFDAHALRRETAAVVRELLDGLRAEYVLLPDPRGQVRQIAVAAEDRDRVIAALHAHPEPGWHVVPLRPRQPEAGVRAYYRFVAPAGQPLGGAELGCVVTFWPMVGRTDVPSPDGGHFDADTRRAPVANDLVAYLSADAWRRAQRMPNRWPATVTSSLFEVREPVDVVYTWVDGDDPDWRARHAEHAGATTGHHASAGAASRYTSRDELRYSLRSVAMYASWVRRIFLVTDRQVPTWLDTTHPQLTVVDHTEIFRDPDALPVFNSHAIESQLHHIDGLAEHYLYVNDDVFLGRPVEPELFFHGNGVAKFFLSPDAIDLDPRTPADLPVMSAAKNHRELMIAEFGRSLAHKFQHGHQPQLRSVLMQLEHAHPQLFEQLARSRFRHPDDLSIASVLHHYYAFAIRRAVPAEMDYRYSDISRPDAPRRLEAILRHHPQVFCLNDMDSDGVDAGTQQSVLREFFEAYYPLPSPYERAGG